MRKQDSMAFVIFISRSPEQLTVEAPAIVIVEAKKSDIKSGIGQCIAEMVAAQRFNAAKVNQSLQLMESLLVELWRFLKLEEQTVSIDLFDYSPPAEQILASSCGWCRRGTPGTRLGRESISAFSAALKVVYIDVTASLGRYSFEGIFSST